MKTAVSSYSFSALKIDDFSCIKLAKEMGFDGIEFAEISVPEGKTKLQHAYDLKKYSNILGLPIVNYVIGADFINRDCTSEIIRLKSEVDVAEVLGVKLMRHDATYGPKGEESSLTGFEKYLPKLSKACREVTEYAKTKGIKTCVENHGIYCQQSDRVEALMNAVDNENFGWLVDIGNFLCADESPIHAVAVGIKYMFYAHVKDFYFVEGKEEKPNGYFDSRAGNHLCGCVIGDGIVPVKECINLIKSIGYDGWMTLEYEGIESPMTGVPKSYQYLKNTMAL